jgi:flagellar basal-body rod modification protein FlgD
MSIQTVSLNNIAGPSQAAAESQTTDKKDALGRDEFLKLLITQLKNQDPLNPMQSVEFTSQLAQFSSLEQLFNVGGHLESIKTSLLLQGGDQLVHYIGKSVKSAGKDIAVRDGEIEPAIYHLDDDAEVQVSVYASDGALVRTLHMGSQKKGDHQVSWDGKDEAGRSVAEGEYRFQVKGIDVSGQPVSSQTYVAGEVTGVRHESGKAFLVVGERRILPESILEVNQL